MCPNLEPKEKNMRNGSKDEGLTKKEIAPKALFYRAHSQILIVYNVIVESNYTSPAVIRKHDDQKSSTQQPKKKLS